MLQQIIGTVRRADLLPSHHFTLSRLFTVSIPRFHRSWKLISPEDRRRKYNSQGDQYSTDEAFRTQARLRAGAHNRARRALLNEDQRRQETLLRSFRHFVNSRLIQGKLPHWESHVPEVVDESVVCHCTSCGRMHYKGRTRTWWRNKQDGKFEVSTGRAK